MNKKEQEKKCIFCKRVLSNERVPICHKCRNTGIEYGVGILSLGAAAVLGINNKKFK